MPAITLVLTPHQAQLVRAAAYTQYQTFSGRAYADEKIVSAGVDSGNRMRANYAKAAEFSEILQLITDVELDPSVVECKCGAVANVGTVDRFGVQCGFIHLDGCEILAEIVASQ